MDVLAPDGPVYQAGTLSGNPLAMAAGIAALEELQSAGVHEELEAMGARLEAGMRAASDQAGVPVTFQRIASMSCGYFTDSPVHNLGEAMASDHEMFKKYFHGMLKEGIYMAPSAFEAGFISAAHTEDDIDRTIAAAEKVLKEL
jgi:glutamate-1-semialdehyde 2,1-aminomutase